MPSILFIFLIAFLVFGPRKLPEIATQALRARDPWEHLMKLLTESVNSSRRESAPISTSSAGLPKPAAAPAEMLASLAKSAGGD